MLDCVVFWLAELAACCCVSPRVGGMSALVCGFLVVFGVLVRVLV